ncbi:MAG: 30S ribosomal protein S8e [Candidatus Lokiarchaeota archaeon]|nr:30S ribosomal protein S8e [Candidatus Lokiarchaeota archaeon]
MFTLARSQARSKRKFTGKKYKTFHKKRKRELERPSIETQIGQEKKKKQRTMGGNHKLKLFSTSYINVTDLKSNKTSKVKILKFDSNESSKDLNRRHIITKGAVVDTEIGKAKVTSRPGQHGVMNGILVQ